MRTSSIWDLCRRPSTTRWLASMVVTSPTTSRLVHRAGRFVAGGGSSCRLQDPGDLLAGANADLDAKYAASLAKIPDGKAKTRGVTFGELAADTLIAQRKR